MKNNLSGCATLGGIALLVLYGFWMAGDWLAQQGAAYALTSTAQPPAAAAAVSVRAVDTPRPTDTPRPREVVEARPEKPSLLQLIESGIIAQQTADALAATSAYQAQYESQIYAAQTTDALEYARRETAQAEIRLSELAAQQAATNSAMTATAGAEERALQIMIVEMTARASDAQATATIQAALTETAECNTQKTLEASEMQTKSVATSQAVERRNKNEQLTSTAWALFWLLLPVSLLVLGIVLAVRLIWHKTEITPIRADSTGKYPLVLRNGQMINGNLQTQPVMNAEKPAPAPSEVEIHVKQDEQRIDAVRALPRVAQPAQLPQDTGRGFVMLSENALPPQNLMPDAGVIGVIDGDWQGE